MVKNHLKRINMPKTWQVKRKGITFITRPNPGQASLALGLSISTLIKDILKMAQTTREVKSILNNQHVMVDNVRRKDHRYAIGFMDVISFPTINKHYRMILTPQGKIMPKEITEKESKLKVCQIKGKTLFAGKIQLNLSDGRNVLVTEKGYKIGDSIVFDLASGKITDTIKLEKGCHIILTGGKHMGQTGAIVDIKGNGISYKNAKGETADTLKKYAYCTGKDKEMVTVK